MLLARRIGEVNHYKNTRKLHGESLLFLSAELIIMLSVILVAAKVGGEIAERFLKIPALIGELTAGIIIGPHALGGIRFFDRFGPMFREVGPYISEAASHAGDAVEPAIPFALYFVGQLGAVLLLFEAGLETDRQRFLKFIRPATAVALGGVIFPFALGVLVTLWFGYATFDSIHDAIPALFVGAILTATSVGITARVLSDISRLDSIEGVIILAAAVVDDVLGIVIVAIIVAIEAEGTVSGGSVALLIVKAFGFWLGLTLIGSILANRISRLTMWFQSDGATLVLAITLGFIAASVAEVYFGLAMIIGAFSMGLALSATVLKEYTIFAIQNGGSILVPVFFCIIGMQVDLTAVAESDNLGRLALFALAVTAIAIITKVAGAGLPVMAVGFGRERSWRIGLGMLPRGEVALIVAEIGRASGIIGRDIFTVAIVMTVITTVIAPIFLVKAFGGGQPRRRGHAQVRAH